MDKEILLVVDVVSSEKGVDKEVIFEAIEIALATAAKKRSREDIDVKVVIDRQTGDHETFRRWEVIEDGKEEIEFPGYQMELSEAILIDPDIEVGQFVTKPIKSSAYSRIGAQVAKQVIVQKVREAERRQIVDIYKQRVGEMLRGVVKHVKRSKVLIDLGNNVEGCILRDNLIPREVVRPGDFLRAYLTEIRPDASGPQLFLSRTAPELLIQLFMLEVPEINEGIIDIVDGARDPGVHAKIAVRVHEPRIDPIGACVGMRGSRVQAVSNELAGERVDVCLWDENPAQFVINAMSPVEVVSIMVDEDAHSMDIAVEDDQLSQAIGRGGQNIRLVSELTKWNLNVMSVEAAEEKVEAEAQAAQKIFMEQLDIDDEMAAILVQEGFSSIDELAYIPESEMLSIEEFDAELVNELRGRARDVILTRDIASEQKLVNTEPHESLLQLEGMNNALAYQLAAKGIVTSDDLADQAVDDLREKIEDIDEEQAGKLIMTARTPWFEAEK